MAYFVAPWYEITSGAVLAMVEVQICSIVGGTSDCWPGPETWSISQVTRQTTVVRTAHFHGQVVGVG